MIVNEEHRADLIKIAKEYQYSSQAYPADENGEPKEAYLEYISLMWNPELAKIMLEIPVLPKFIDIEKLAEILNIDKYDLSSKLEEPVKRGFVNNRGNFYTRPTPLQIHDIPFILQENLNREDAVEFAKLSREYFDGGYYRTWENSRRTGIPRTRVLTVQEKVDTTHEIVPIEAVFEIIDSNTDIAVFPCPCRARRDLEGDRKCKDKYPVNNCINFGRAAKAMIMRGDPATRAITREEAKKITMEAHELGLVSMTDNNATEAHILCHCCECCCGNLAGLTRLDNPGCFGKANYISSVDEELCVACGTCIERCKFNAITVDDFAKITPEKCVGCGLCAVTCPEDAITMTRVEREEIPPMRVRSRS